MSELTRAEIKAKISELSDQLAVLSKLDRSSRIDKAKATKQANAARKKELLDSYTNICMDLVGQNSEPIEFSAVVTHSSRPVFRIDTDGKLRVLLDKPHEHDQCSECYADECSCELCQHIEESSERMSHELNEILHMPRLTIADKKFDFNGLFLQAWKTAQKNHKAAAKQQGQSDMGEGIEQKARS